MVNHSLSLSLSLNLNDHQPKPMLQLAEFQELKIFVQVLDLNMEWSEMFVQAFAFKLSILLGIEITFFGTKLPFPNRGCRGGSLVIYLLLMVNHGFNLNLNLNHSLNPDLNHSLNHSLNPNRNDHQPEPTLRLAALQEPKICVLALEPSME